MIPTIIILSFILESVVSNFISFNSLFMPLLTLMSFIIVYPYFNKNNKKFLAACFITGMFYDLIYTDTIIIHGFLFLIIGYLIIKLNLLFPNNSLNVMIKGLICIILYRIISYFLLLITANTPFDILLLLKSIYHSLILNLIYVSLVYIIVDSLSIKLKIKKIN